MTEIQNKNSCFSDLLEKLIDSDLNKRNYSAILQHLEVEDQLKFSDFEKLTELCLQEYNTKNTFSISSLKILSSLLQKDKKIHINCPSRIVKLLEAILSTLQNNVNSSSINQTLCFKILMLFPDECLITGIVDYHKEFYTIIDHYCQEVSPELVLQSLTLTLKLLLILPAPNKEAFVKYSLNLWFSTLIPTIFNVAKDESQGLSTALKLLEVLTQELLQYDYFENKQWKLFFGNISSHYIPIILNILNNGHDHWSKLWIACIKLLKSKVTSPALNKLLVVEENAFKMDDETRCIAFQCWNVLINTFSLQNTRFINKKRIKLLTLPLLSYKAKSEEIALAKFGSWWHLITNLYNKCDFLADYLDHFLMFCFGKPQTLHPLVPAGMFSSHTKKLCIQAFANILGHNDCTCCVELESIKEKCISAEDILKNKRIWYHSLTIAIEICVELEEDEIRKQLKCAWKSFIVKFCELSHDILRKEQILELLSVLQISQQKCCFGTSNLIINTLIPTLFEIDKDKLTALIDDSGILDKIQETLTDASNNNFYSSCDIDETLRNIRQYTDYVIRNERDLQNLKLDNLMEKLPSSMSGVMLWTAYVESVINFKYTSCSRSITNIVMWPIKQDIASNLQKFIKTWINLYNFLDSENIKSEPNTKVIHTINNKLLMFLSGNKSVRTAFSLTSIVLLIKQNIKERGVKLQKQEGLFLKILTKQVNDEYITPTVYLHLLECLELLSDLFKVHKDIPCVKKILIISNITLKITPKIISENKDENTNLVQALEIFLKTINNLIKIEEYSKFNLVIIDGVKKIAFYFAEIPQLSILVKQISPILSTYEDKDKDIKELLGKMSPELIAKETLNMSKDQLTAPTKKATLTTSTVNIVDRVVDNGEEFVQVETNWKFNPKKLTENQKEKLQRKREDIPALYQDLSQSQDEFKLTTWRTDSNDTTSSSKSSNVKATNQNIGNKALVFPKIVLENINNKNTNLELQSISPKSQLKLANKTKSPRITLKDRVSRNVQNLKEKSILTMDSVSPCLVVCTKISLAETAKTNIGTINDVDNVSPAANNYVRPVRKTKTPSKYIDTITGVKKKVHQRSSEDDVSQYSTEESDAMSKKNSDSNKLKKKPEFSIKDNIQSNNNNASTDSPKNYRNIHGRKITRLQKHLSIDMVGSQLYNCTGTDDQTYATRNKISSANATTKSIESEYVKEIQPNSDSASQDIIESSQDSSVTAISAFSTMSNIKKKEIASSNKNQNMSNSNDIEESLLVLSDNDKNVTLLPENNTVSLQTNLSEETDTEPVVKQKNINNECNVTQTLILSSSSETPITSNTQNTAEADTQQLDFKIDIVKEELNDPLVNRENDETVNEKMDITSEVQKNITHVLMSSSKEHPMLESIKIFCDREDASSPLKDNDQRRKDFLNNTLEMSPIKTMSPVRDEETPSPETSSDYDTINLGSSVLANGEPCDISESPEIFTENKTSPHKSLLFMSPLSDKATVGTNSSPSTGLSRKKKSQVHSGGRGAQMLGLCVPETSMCPLEKNSEESNTTAKRNLKSLYNDTDTDSSYDTDDSEVFLKLIRNLPSKDCSPAGPILKRKHAEMAEGTTPSPASKKKRVSLHDPPVSTTMYVKKYIGPRVVRSPKSSIQKRQERLQMSSLLESENTEDTLSSLDTQVVDVVDSSNLDNIDPICPRLTACEDPIENIAAELSSPAMKTLLVKEFEGNIMTVGDLARLTELEINRLCIKAPKVAVAKKILQDYLKHLNKAEKSSLKEIDVEIQTDVLNMSTSFTQTPVLDISTNFTQTPVLDISTNFTQTTVLNTSSNFTQTDKMEITHQNVQTEISGDVVQESDIAEYLSKKPDIINTLDREAFEAVSQTVLNRLEVKDCCKVLDTKIGLNSSNNKERIELYTRYLRERFDTKDLISFLCEVLMKVNDNS